MDLAAIYEKYQVIINLASGLVIAVAGYFFGKWDSERKRKWELTDRQFKEAYASLNAYRSLVEVIEKYEESVTELFNNMEQEYKGLSDEERRERIKNRVERAEDYFRGYSQAPKLLWDALEMNTSIVLLRDRKLSGLNNKLLSLIASEVTNIHDFDKELAKLDSYESSDVVKYIDTELNRIQDYSTEAHSLIRNMKLRLAELAKKVP
jgi:lysyl-tRNA synthetase class I